MKPIDEANLTPKFTVDGMFSGTSLDRYEQSIEENSGPAQTIGEALPAADIFNASDELEDDTANDILTYTLSGMTRRSSG